MWGYELCVGVMVMPNFEGFCTLLVGPLLTWLPCFSPCSRSCRRMLISTAAEFADVEGK